MWDLHRLRLLRELEIRGTVTAVAESLNYSASSVSQQLAKLEDEVGATLLEREGRRLRLTERGRTVARHAARVMELEEQVRGELESAPATAAVVRVATLETTASALLPRALSIVRTTHPGLRVEAAVVPPEQSLPELETHRFDIAIAEQYPGHTRERPPGIDRRMLGGDPIRLVVPRDAAATCLADVRAHPWIVEPAGTAARHWTIQQCRSAGFEPDIQFEAADLQAHIHLVAAGHAVSMLPDLVWAGEEPAVRVVELPGAPHRELFTSVRRSARSHPAIGAVRTALNQAFEELSARRDHASSVLDSAPHSGPGSSPPTP